MVSSFCVKNCYVYSVKFGLNNEFCYGGSNNNCFSIEKLNINDHNESIINYENLLLTNYLEQPCYSIDFKSSNQFATAWGDGNIRNFTVTK